MISAVKKNKKNCVIVNRSYTNIIFCDTLKLKTDTILENNSKSKMEVATNNHRIKEKRFYFDFGNLWIENIDLTSDQTLFENLEFLNNIDERKKTIELLKQIQKKWSLKTETNCLFLKEGNRKKSKRSKLIKKQKRPKNLEEIINMKKKSQEHSIKRITDKVKRERLFFQIQRDSLKK